MLNNDSEELSFLMAAMFEAAAMVACRDVDFQPSRFNNTLLKTRAMLRQMRGVGDEQPPASSIKRRPGRPQKETR